MAEAEVAEAEAGWGWGWDGNFSYIKNHGPFIRYLALCQVALSSALLFLHFLIKI